MTSRKGPGNDKVLVNRAPVLTLWAAIVAQRMGFDWPEAVTLGRAVAGLNAQAKGQTLGLFEAGKPGDLHRTRKAAKPGTTGHVELFHRSIPVVRTPEGFRALRDGRPTPPESVERYLEVRFGPALKDTREAMDLLAGSIPAEELSERAFELYESFRPSVPRGVRGWGVAGELDLALIRSLVPGKRKGGGSQRGEEG